MDFDRIIIKENKNTVDTVSRREFIIWTGSFNIYTSPSDIKAFATYRREPKIKFLQELDEILYKHNLK